MLHMTDNDSTKWHSYFCSHVSHRDSNFYACSDREQTFVNVEHSIAYFEVKGEIIAFGYMNALTLTL